MKKAFSKDVFRSITHSMSRFLAIAAIVALGSGFYTGLRTTAPHMRATVDAYADEQQMMDLQLLSTMGFTEGDVEAIRDTDGIKAVMPGYLADTLVTLNDKESVVRIHSLPKDMDTSSEDYLNQPVLKEGRMPERSGECVINEMDLEGVPTLLGQTLTLEDPEGILDDNLSVQTYTVVGIVKTPYYLSFSLGQSNNGLGSIDNYMYVPEEDFCQPYYTNLYATVDGAQELDAFSDDYQATVDDAVQNLEKLANDRAQIRVEELRDLVNKQLDEAQQKLDSSKADADKQLADAAQKLADGEREIAENEQKLSAAEQQLQSAAAQIESGWSAYNNGVQELAQKRIDTEAQFAAAEQQLADGEAQANEAQAQLESAKAELDAQSGNIEQAQAAKEQLNNTIAQLQQAIDWAELIGADRVVAALTAQMEELQAQLAQVEDALAQYDNAVAQYESGMAQLEASRQQLANGRAELESQRAQAPAQFAAAEQQLAQSKETLQAGEAELASGRTELEQGRAQLAAAKKQLEDGRKEYEASKTEAEQKIADGQREIDEEREKITDFEAPTWYVLDRDSNVGFASFDGDADRMDSLSTVLPILFFLVAALVSLTTMTRMVDEERVLIGTYKALGYSKGKIAFKYLFYAALATISGSILGSIALGNVIPVVCWNSYRIMYTGPDLIWSFPWKFALIGCLASACCTMLASVSACRSSLTENPSVLMLPKAPRAGKRILLEHIKPIWKRMKFSQKVTARNLFLYKRRLIMTVVGIAGCTALLLTGFGIKDSVSGILTNQYEDIYQYNMVCTLKEKGVVSPETEQLLADSDAIDRYLKMSSTSAEVFGADDSVYASIVVPEHADELKDFVKLRTRRGHEDIPFGEDSVVITEKLAKLLNLSVGDTFSIKNSQNEQVEFQVDAITEHYLSHCVYLSPALYEQVTGDAPLYDQIIAVCAEEEASEQTIADALVEQDDVGSVDFTDNLSESFNTMIDSLDYVILVIIVCSGLLAFVVLYNLTNINVTERVREIATIKVLGFYDKEVSAYVYRETSVLTAIGCLLGLALGVVMHSFVIQTVEVEMVMFGRQVQPMSFVYAALLTLVFAIIVNLVMGKKLRNISMVESLKSVD